MIQLRRNDRARATGGRRLRLGVRPAPPPRRRLGARLPSASALVAAGAAAAAVARGAGAFSPADDRAVADKLKEVLAASGGAEDVTVDVVGGVATLRGQLRTRAQIDGLVRACGRVNGVERVESWLHLPGTPAPNKADARRAGGPDAARAVHHGARRAGGPSHGRRARPSHVSAG